MDSDHLQPVTGSAVRPRYCGTCGAPVSNQDAYCGNCGRYVGVSAESVELSSTELQPTKVRPVILPLKSEPRASQPKGSFSSWQRRFAGFVVLGGVIQGFLSRYQVEQGLETSVSGLGVLVALVGLVFIRKRWGWKTLLFVPLVFVLTIPIAMTTEVTYGLSRRVLNDSDTLALRKSAPKECNGLPEYYEATIDLSKQSLTILDASIESSGAGSVDTVQVLKALEELRLGFDALRVPEIAVELHLYSLATIDMLIDAFNQRAAGNLVLSQVMMVRIEERVSEAEDERLWQEVKAACT
jgi:hypothetical protein